MQWLEHLIVSVGKELMLTDIDIVLTVLPPQQWEGKGREGAVQARLITTEELSFELTFHIALEGLAHYSSVVFFFCWPLIDIDCSPRGSGIKDYSILRIKKEYTGWRNKQWQLKYPYAAALYCTTRHLENACTVYYLQERLIWVLGS